MTRTVNIGYVPLTDAAPLIVAHELGFANEEGLSINLIREQSWATIRDKLSFGIIDAAHVLLPIALEISLGLGPTKARIDVPLVLNMNGNSFVANNETAQRLAQAGATFGNARSLGEAIISLGQQRPLRVAVPFMQSMHVTMLRYLVQQLGHHPANVLEFYVSPPSEIETTLRTGSVDAFMVGAPWGTNAVENGSGQMMLTSNAIWQGAPEKVLGLRHDWAQQNPQTTINLIRAIYRAGNWIANHANASVLSEILSRECYLNLNAGIVEQYLRGQVVINNNGLMRNDPLALQFDLRRIGFPWKSSTAWIARQNAAFWGVDPQIAGQVARDISRTDIYRAALESMYAPLPLADEKIEGSLSVQTAVPGIGDPMLGPDAFFDGSIYDLA